MSHPHLETRGFVFWYRRKIPLDLLPAYDGKREIRHSLHTRNYDEAERKARKRSVELDDEFVLRRGGPGAAASMFPKLTRVDITDSNIESLCERWKRAVLESDDANRMAGFIDKDYQGVSEGLDDVEQPLRMALAKGQLEQIDPVLRSFLWMSRIEVDENSPKFPSLRYRFLQTLVETVEFQQRRQRGEVLRTDTVVPMVAVEQRQESGEEDGAMRMEELFNLWNADVKGRPVGSVLAFKTAFEQFRQFIGDRPVAEVNKKLVIAFRDKLLHEDKRAVTTVETKMDLLAAMFQVLVDSEKLALNPAARVRVPKPKVEPVTRVPYALKDMMVIFSGPIYTGGTIPRAGAGDAAKWLPPLGFYSASRLEELCQLLVSDIANDARFGWYMYITEVSDEEGSDKGIKTTSSRRRVPIHPELIEAGFLRYVERRRKAGDVRLFPELKQDSKGNWSGNWSKWWGRYARKVLGIQSKLKVFHSTRTNFKDACREADLKEEVHDALTGHSGGGVGRDYKGEFYPLRPLVKAIKKVKYYGFKLPIIEP